MSEEIFHQDVLKSLDYWTSELKSKTKEDFDSPKDYGDWVERCVINTITVINNSRYEYYESIVKDRLDKSLSNLRRNANE